MNVHTFQAEDSTRNSVCPIVEHAQANNLELVVGYETAREFLAVDGIGPRADLGDGTCSVRRKLLGYPLLILKRDVLAKNTWLAIDRK